jgi:hypothetical protein
LTIRTPRVTRPVSSPSGRSSVTFARTRIVSPRPTGRLSTAPSIERRASTTRGSIGSSPSAYEITSIPCATRRPKGLSAAKAASACWGCQSPVSAANETTSCSVTVRPEDSIAAPISRPSK